MELEKLKIGLAVSFHKLKNGKCVGLENEVYTIEEINFKYWQPCNCRLRNENGTVYTNHLAIEPVERKTPAYRQISIFDLLEA